MTLRQQLFGFRGRLRRLDWWVLGILTGLVDGVIGTLLRLGFAAADPPAGSIALPVAGLVLGAPFLWIYLALNAKRMHDLNWPAWPVIVVTLVLEACALTPVGTLGWFDTLLPIGALSVTVLDVVNWTFVLAVLIVLGFIDGTRGPNRFGPSPKLQARPVFLEPDGVG
jgi:uncharacterized membrane protein YhaH (DUF805 family)